MSDTYVCLDCGVDWDIDFVFSRKDWLLIHPDCHGELCANCIIKRASKLPHIINVQGRLLFSSDPLFDDPERTTSPIASDFKYLTNPCHPATP